MSAPLSVASPEPSLRRARLQRVAIAVVAGLVVIVLGAGWLLWDNRRLDVTSYDVPVPQLPEAADGLRIAQVSDLHAASFGTFPDRVVAAVETAQPDLIAVTGDLIDIRTVGLDGVLAVANRLQQIAPTYYVLGNHEADSVLQSDLLSGLEDLGVVILRDEAVTEEIAGASVTLIGLDDPRVDHSAGRDATGAREVLTGLDLPEGRATILLAHRPELLDDYAGTGIDLVLSGHAHGGQVRIPGVGGMFAPHQGWFPDLTEGVHSRGGTSMVVSRGLGNSIAGVRVNNPRELVVVDLRTA